MNQTFHVQTLHMHYENPELLASLEKLKMEMSQAVAELTELRRRLDLADAVAVKIGGKTMDLLTKIAELSDNIPDTGTSAEFDQALQELKLSASELERTLKSNDEMVPDREPGT